MARLRTGFRTGFRTCIHVALENEFPRLGVKKKPIVLSQWPLASCENDQHENDQHENEPAREREIHSPQPLPEKNLLGPSGRYNKSSSEYDEASLEKDIESSREHSRPSPGNGQAAHGHDEAEGALSQPQGPANSFGYKRLIASGSINGMALDAVADSGASFSVISQELASMLGLTIDQASAISVYLPSGAILRTLGKAAGVFNFSGETESYTLLCIVLEKCSHPLVLGSQFLRATRTLTKYTNRVKNVFSNFLGLNFLAVLEAEQYLLDGYLNGQAADIIPDTGSDIMAMSLLYAEQLGLTIYDGPQNRTKVQFIDGSEALTFGMVRGVRWRFQMHLDWGTHMRRRGGYDFHIIEHLPVDVIVSNDFIQELEVFKHHEHRLVLRQPKQSESGIYGIRFIESLRGHKKGKSTHGQSSPAEMEESELHRRDAAEEDIEELLTSNSVVAESKRPEEQERRRAQDERKRRYDDARLASVPPTTTISTGGIARPAQQPSTSSSVHDVNLTQQRNGASSQTQAGPVPGASLGAQSGRPQAKRRRLDLPGWFNGSH